nr:hypothetical protein [Granulibacter bethesdensis]
MVLVASRYLQRPHFGDVVFGSVGVVDDDDIWIAKKGADVEQAGIGGNSDLGSSSVIRLGRRRIILLRAGKADSIDPVAVLRLIDSLVDELSRRAKIDDAFLELAPALFRNQQTDQRLAASCRQLKGNILFIDHLLAVGAEHVALVRHDIGQLPPGQGLKKLCRRVRRAQGRGVLFECHRSGLLPRFVSPLSMPLIPKKLPRVERYRRAAGRRVAQYSFCAF